MVAKRGDSLGWFLTLSCGFAVALALSLTLYGCGKAQGTAGPTLTQLTASKISVGVYHVCMVANDSSGWCWGLDDSGELGNGNTVSSVIPVQVTVAGSSGFNAISAGGWTSNNIWPTSNVITGAVTCAISVSGSVSCWGKNYYGQLGNNTTTDSLKAAVQVQGLTSGATAVAVGNYHACALANGGVQCWGSGGSGQLGNGGTGSSNVPVQVTGLTSGVTAIATSPDASHTCAIVNGGAQCWGYNYNGQLGNNTALTSCGSGTQSNVPVQVQGLTSGVTAIAVGNSHSCAVVNGGVQCWGYNFSGQLGNGTYTCSAVPVQVSGITSGATAVATGDNFSCAVVNGGAQCWGYAWYGSLGVGSASVNMTLPNAVSGLTSGVSAIAAGGYTACALLSSGSVSCWGYGLTGQLGNGSNADSVSPVSVTLPSVSK